MRILIFMLIASIYAAAHPVSYSIDLNVKYDDIKKEATVECKSNSRNKCGLHNFHFLDSEDKIIKTAKFPFLKKKTMVSIDQKPAKMVFFLRKIPDHTYVVIVE